MSYTYKEGSEVAWDKYTVIPYPRIAYSTRSVKIEAAGEILTLCEVSIYGGKKSEIDEAINE